MTGEREARIAERRAQMPRSYRALYDKAVSGKSLRAAINSFCLECVCWATNEVRNCSDKGCPLWAVRPYQDVPQTPRKGRDTAVEYTNAEQPE